MLGRRHIPFVTTCCANCFILLVMVVDLLLCLIYKSNFIIGMHREEKHSRLRVHYYPWFQASIGGFGRGFPGGSDGKESACNRGDPGSIPG